MTVTLWLILFILSVIAITYPEEFPTLIRNPDELLRAVGLETRRRWMILKFGTALWIEKQKLRYSLWKAQPIIKAEREKQQLKEENNVD